MNVTEFENSLSKIISEFSDDVIETTGKIQDAVAKEAVAELKASSPKKSGKYAKGWTSTVTTKSRTGKTRVIHNKNYQLTHLLENGHITRNGTKRTRAIPHIAPVEQKVIDKYESRIKNEI